MSARLVGELSVDGNSGRSCLTLIEGELGDCVWFFPCRLYAVQFAARRGIRIEGEAT